MVKNYNNGKIYKLISNNTNDIYIGSTSCPRLCTRLQIHKDAYKRYLNNTGRYYSGCELLKYPDCKIILLENYPCSTKEELFSKEREYIEKNNCVNLQKPIMTRDELLQYHKDYYSNNIYYFNEVSKNYREKNRELIKERDKIYYTNNKEKRNKKASEVIVCDCGKNTTKAHLSRHKKTKFHLDFLADVLEANNN